MLPVVTVLLDMRGRRSDHEGTATCMHVLYNMNVQINVGIFPEARLLKLHQVSDRVRPQFSSIWPVTMKAFSHSTGYTGEFTLGL